MASLHRPRACETNERRGWIHWDGFAGAGALLGTCATPTWAASKLTAQPLSVGASQKAGQIDAINALLSECLAKTFDPIDAPYLVRLALNDVLTYDRATRTGGANGSIRFEMDRPENVKLKPYFDKLSTVKKEVDARLGPSGPISWADLVYVAGKVATRKKWLNEKVDKLQGKMSSEMVQQSYGTPWTARIGRVDAEEADPAGRIPGPGASLEELRDFYLKFDNPKPEDKGSFLGGKAPYNQRYSYLLISLMAEDRESIQQQMASLDPEWAKAKEKYDISLKTLTRTEYEIDTSRLYNKIMQVGSFLDVNRYLVEAEQVKVKL